MLLPPFLCAIFNVICLNATSYVIHLFLKEMISNMMFFFLEINMIYQITSSKFLLLKALKK